MATSKYDRSNFIPKATVSGAISPTSQQILDVMGSTYLKADLRAVRYMEYQVTDAEAGLPDAISFKFYGTSDLWWVLCYFNGIIDPFTDLYPGRKIRVPNQSDIPFLSNNQIGQFGGSAVGSYVVI